MGGKGSLIYLTLPNSKKHKHLCFNCTFPESFWKISFPAVISLPGILEHKTFPSWIFTLTSVNFYLFFLPNFTNALFVHVYLSITIYRTITLIDLVLTSNSLRSRLFSIYCWVPVAALIPYSAHICHHCHPALLQEAPLNKCHCKPSSAEGWRLLKSPHCNSLFVPRLVI